MQLQGMDICPRDLDIVVQLKDLDKMREIFSNNNYYYQKWGELNKSSCPSGGF